VLSGASGLVYQIAWVRLLALTFGVTIYAISTVVAAFMGGLALGSFIGGRMADRVRRPILWYAGAELVIGALGLASPKLLAWVEATYLALYPRNAAEAAVVIIALRFALAAAVLLVPTTLMGATLPLIVRGSMTIRQTIGHRISFLYASNTTGAILGTLAAGFVLIGGIGISGTVQVAAALNGLAGLSALILGASIAPLPPASAETVPHEKPHEESAVFDVSPGVRRLVILTFTVQGFASLAYEIVWTRVLAILLDGSTYAFSIVLAAVLLGIALGSALVAPLMSRRLPWVRVYAVIQAAVAILSCLGTVVFAHAYGIMHRLDAISILTGLLENHYGWMGILVIVAILPPMVLLGASFAVAARIVVSGSANTGRDLGVLYAGNTFGAILGAWAAGFFLIPTFGTHVSIELLAVVNAILAVALASTGSRRELWLAGGIVVASMATFAVGRVLAPSMYERIVAGRFPGNAVVWVGEGLETSVAVVQNPETGIISMYQNGQADASTESGMVWFHRLLGHLPMILNRDPQDVLIVGIGGGSTAGALAEHNPRRLDVVELSDTMVQGSRYFSAVNGNVLEYPKLHLTIDDGRNHLLLYDQKYDVVTADSIHPRNAGSSVLYSYEYYKLVAQALKPGGLMSQWLEDRPDNPDNEAQRKLMARTFARAFPYVTMWAYGAIMIGSNEPIDTSLSSIQERWDKRNLGRDLEGSGFESPEAVHSLYVMSDEDLRKWAGDGPIMTDDHPYVEYYLSLPGGTGGLPDPHP